MKAAALRAQLESELGGRWPSPFTFRERPAAETVSSGIAQIDSLTGAGGLPRGALTEIFGPDSSGRTSLLLSLLAQMTAREEACALVDSTDAFDPQSARRVPMAFRLRFRRAVEYTPTVLVVLDQAPYAKTCASLVLRLEPHAAQFSVFTCQLSVNRRGKAFN